MRTQFDSFRRRARLLVQRYRHDCRGAALIEFAMCLPLLILMFAGALVLQDAIRMGYLNSKASYTLADMVSREDESINAAYFDGLDSVFDYIIDDRYPGDLRVTTIECTANCTDEEDRVLEVCWSRASDGFAALNNVSIGTYAGRTPLFAEGDTLLVTETYLNYTPPVFANIFAPRRYEAFAFTRPRIAGQIKFDTGTIDEFGNQIFSDCFNNG
ncbi:MAG: TadE/TadG family type IV pilus assembly protein [Pseudomonadota bacterium]